MNSEQKSLSIVNKYEKIKHRKPEILQKRGSGFDIKSGNRFIEVKSTKWDHKNYGYVEITEKEYEKLKQNPKRFYLYIVYSIKNKPYLGIFRGDNLVSHKQITPSKFRINFTKRIIKSMKPIHI